MIVFLKEIIKPVANGFAHKLGGDGAIDAATYGANYTAGGPTYFPDPGNLFSNELFLIKMSNGDVIKSQHQSP